jgi:predicted amidohydrolase YtcJ
MVVVDGVVAAIGSRSSLAGDGVTRDFGDAYLLPGMRDAHMHPVAYAAALRGTTLAKANNFDDIVTRLRQAARPGSQTAVLGMRLNEETLAERKLPTGAVLDAAVADRPVMVHRYCGHVAIANHAAMRLAGITPETPDPPGGSIDRDQNGKPTGVLRETAIELVSESLGQGNEVSRGELLDALSRLAAVGITSIGAILRTGRGAWASLGNEVDIAIAAAGESPVKMGAYTIEETVAGVVGAKLRIDAAPQRLRWLGIKRFGDGSFGGHTAAMDEPFVDVPTTGTLRLTRSDEDIVREALALGGGAAVHAIGDLACRSVVDMFGDLIDTGADPRKLRIEHASVLRLQDIERLAAYGILAAVQPPFLGSEADWLINRLGADRLEHTYPFRTMERAGVTLAGSSDCPVESPDPWAGMALARDRAGMVPAEGLSAGSALAMYTTGAARALEEPEPLSVGSPADFIVVDRDPVVSSADQLRDTRVIATFVDGQEVQVDRSLPLWLD